MKKKRLSAAMLAMVMLLSGCGASANKGEGAYMPKNGGSLTKTDSLAGGASGGGAIGADDIAGGMSSSTYEGKRGDMGSSSMGEAPMESAMADSFAPMASSTSSDTSFEDRESVISESEDGWFAEDEMVEPIVDSIDSIDPIEPMPGLLTAGEWCDNQNWGFMANLVNTGRFDFHVYGMKPYERVVLHVLSDGAAAPNVKAELMDAEGNKIAESVTDYAGTAYLYYNVYADDAGEPAYVIISANDTSVRAELLKDEVDIGLKCPVTGTENPWDGEGQDKAEGQEMPGGQETPEGQEVPEGQEMPEGPEVQEGQEVPEGQGTADGQGIPQNGQDQQVSAHLKSYELTVEITDYVRPAKRLDVMFVFDTTGSMGDELLYLQKEFEDIAARVADQSTRFSVNFYRDFEDEYVVRPNEFTSDIDKVAGLLNAEYADGGGDYEEAVDLALVNAVLEHDWNADSVKLLFLILDAPPHNTAEVAANLKKAVSAASFMGIRIIPIASSGVDTATEALLRSMAMLTGGTYTFLTNDSGIGGDHLEPTIGSYTVEALNDLIVRLIRQYYQ